MKNKIAIFDVDGTIFRSSLLNRLLDILIFRKVFKRRVLKQVNQVRSAWFNRKTDYQTYSDTLVDIFRENIAGAKQTEIKFYSQELIKTQKSIYFKYTRDLIGKLRKDHILIAISGSLKETLDYLNEYIKFDYVFGTEFAINKNGVYTGTVLNEPVLHKKKFLQLFIKSNNFSLKKSLAVGDTDSDLGVLKMVEIPIAFNPDNRLYEYAKTHNWKIVVERKNVIYNIQK